MYKKIDFILSGVKLNKTILLTFLFILNLNFFTLTANAQDSKCGQGLFPDLVVCGRSASSACQEQAVPCGLKHIPIVFGNLIEFAIIFVLLLIPIYIMFIGVRMILAQGVPDELKKLKASLFKASGYFILIFASWLIVKTITDTFGVSSDVPSFLLDRDGSVIENRGTPTTNK
jgi:hypothetical protein